MRDLVKKMLENNKEKQERTRRDIKVSESSENECFLTLLTKETIFMLLRPYFLRRARGMSEKRQM